MALFYHHFFKDFARILRTLVCVLDDPHDLVCASALESIALCHYFNPANFFSLLKGAAVSPIAMQKIDTHLKSGKLPSLGEDGLLISSESIASSVMPQLLPSSSEPSLQLQQPGLGDHVLGRAGRTSLGTSQDILFRSSSDVLRPPSPRVSTDSLSSPSPARTISPRRRLSSDAGASILANGPRFAPRLSPRESGLASKGSQETNFMFSWERDSPEYASRISAASRSIGFLFRLHSMLLF